MFQLSFHEILKYWIFFIIVLTVHQYGHLKVGEYLGDYRYEHSGRNSVNPFRHISLVSMFTGIIFGIMWPKKVEFETKTKSPSLRRNQKILFGVAGSLANLAFGLLILFSVSLLLWVAKKSMDPSVFRLLSVDMIDLGWMNIYLVLVNLLPLKGFDGYIWVELLFKRFGLSTDFFKGYHLGSYSLLAGILVSGLKNYHLYFYDIFIAFRHYLS